MTIQNIFEKKPSKSEGCQVSGKKKKHFPRKNENLDGIFLFEPEEWVQITLYSVSLHLSEVVRRKLRRGESLMFELLTALKTPG